jgi:hypothetical protein
MRAKRFTEEQVIGVLGVQSWREDQGTLQAIWDIEGRHPPAEFSRIHSAHRARNTARTVFILAFMPRVLAL